MDHQENSIPNVNVENIGSYRKPHYAIKGFIELPCWNGHFLQEDIYSRQKDKVITDGRIPLWVDGAITKDRRMLFSAAQINAYRYLVTRQEALRQSIVQGLKQAFPRLLAEEYAAWDHQEGGFPSSADLGVAGDLKAYIGPESISIGEDDREEVAYVTWHFECRWDPEHGFQVITHKDRVIDIGPETDIWKIYKDNGTYEQVLKEYNERSSVSRPRPQKKWWQFWKG